MGGGAAMRAAAKVAGMGMFNNGMRGTIYPDHPVATAARQAVRPATAFTASSPSSVTVKAATASVGVDQEVVQKPSWEIGDWELAGGEEDLFGISGEGKPRVVFGGAPSIEEAKEATSELKEALEKAYLSSSPTPPASPLARFSDTESLDTKAVSELEPLDTKAYVKSESNSQTVVAAATPKHAMQAFRFLQESPAVQNVVASIASDPNVWNAVILNPALQEYLQAQKISASELYEKESAEGDFLSPRSPRSYNAESRAPTSTTSGVMDYLQNLKLRVVDMMNGLSDYFQSVFGGYDGENDAKGNGVAGFMDKALGPSLMGLAVMVIVMVVLKRA